MNGRLVVVAAALSLAAVRGIAPPAPSGHGLLLSDIHFDPLSVGKDTVDKLANSRIEAWDGILEPSLQDPFPYRGSDTNYSLLVSALASADAHEPYDFVLVSGDILRHDFAGEYPEAFVAKTAGFVARKVQQEFGGPVIFAIGNNDSAAGHYMMKKNDAVFAAIAEQLTIFDSNPAAKKEFLYGGYCLLPHPTVPKRDIIVLNSVFWSNKYAGPDYGVGQEQIDWLQARLKEETDQKRQAILVTHIPPGDDAYGSASKMAYVPLWKNDYLAKFSDVLKKFSGSVQGIVAGHLHMDDFRVMSLGKSAVPMRITPSISPSNGNNPAFATLDYDAGTAEIRDFATYFTKTLSAAPPQPYVPVLPWGQEYRFSSAYKRKPLDAAALASLAAAIRIPGPEQDAWKEYYAVLAPSSLDAGFKYFACAQTAVTETEYDACVGSFK